MPVRIEPLTAVHAAATREIFNFYVKNSDVTPERIRRSPAQHNRALDDALSKYIATDESGIIGYAFAKPHAKGRKSFEPAVEIGVYIHPDKHGRGAGTLLVEQMLRDLRTLGKHTALAKMNAENKKSARLFENLGFVEAARLREIGFKSGKRITVVYLQKMLQGEQNVDRKKVARGRGRGPG